MQRDYLNWLLILFFLCPGHGVVSQSAPGIEQSKGHTGQGSLGGGVVVGNGDAGGADAQQQHNKM